MRAIVLAGGQGMRLRPLTLDRPKALVEVNGRALVEYQLDWLAKEGGITHLTFACGYKWERLKAHFGADFNGIPVEYSVEDEPRGTGGAIKMALGQAPSDELVVVTNGDVTTDMPLRKMVEAHKAAGEISASMLVVPYRSPFGVVRIDKLKTVRDFDEKPAFPDVWINGGVYVLNSKRIFRLLPDKGDIERETFPKLVNHGELLSYPYYGEWAFLDTMKDLEKMSESMKASN